MHQSKKKSSREISLEEENYENIYNNGENNIEISDKIVSESQNDKIFLLEDPGKESLITKAALNEIDIQKLVIEDKNQIEEK